MKTWKVIVLVILAFGLFTFGLIFILTADPSLEYVKPTLEGLMTRTQQCVLGIIMVLLMIFICACLIHHPWPWVRRLPCTVCHDKKTRDKDKDGFRVCEDCAHERWKKGLIKKAEEKVAGQPVLRCPNDGTIMGKLVLSGSSIVADNCEKCGRIVLEKEETEELEAKLNQPRGGGSFSGGMMLGMSLGRMG